MKKPIVILSVLIVALVGCHKSSRGTATNPSEGTVGEKKLFVILNDLTADLKTEGNGANGVDGADKLCQADAQNTGGTYRALLVDGLNRVACTTANCTGAGVNEQVNWVLKPNTRYLRAADGTTVVGTTNAKGLFDFPLDNEWVFHGYDLWMGLNTDWTGATDNCTGFTSSAGTGIRGSTAYKTSGAISHGPHSCNYYGTSILCIEQ